MHSNRYIFIYSIVMVVVVAVSLTIVAVQLKPAQENNIRIEKMQNILAAVNIPATPANAEEIYKKVISGSMVVNSKGDDIQGVDAFTTDLAIEMKKEEASRNLPVYVAKLENGDTSFIFPLRGKGLWGPVWGYIALRSDYNSVIGVMFDHKGETPGLGAEINTGIFMKPFIGKKIFDESGKFTSIQIVKGGALPDDIHGVDAISGGTITSKGVEYMIYDCMSSYQEYIKKNRKI